MQPLDEPKLLHDEPRSQQQGLVAGCPQMQPADAPRSASASKRAARIAMINGEVYTIQSPAAPRVAVATSSDGSDGDRAPSGAAMEERR